MQHVFELIHGFISGQAEDHLGHDSPRHMFVFETLFIFILFSNLIGVIPGFVSPTQVIYVPAGCALVSFVYFNVVGIRKHGLVKYTAHFGGPIWWMSPLACFSSKSSAHWQDLSRCQSVSSPICSPASR